ncbi:MAG: hypothetical protein ABID38_02885 [Candidatus Diapherotrites archaeon]
MPKIPTFSQLARRPRKQDIKEASRTDFSRYGLQEATISEKAMFLRQISSAKKMQKQLWIFQKLF